MPQAGESRPAEKEKPEAEPEQAIDLQALAEKVVALLKEEARIERERQGRGGAL